MRLEKSQGYDRGRYVRVQKGDALTRLTADQVEFGATIAYNRLRNPIESASMNLNQAA
jgi:hypothetical protein